MKALVGWNILHQVPGLINMIVFFTRTKNDMVRGHTRATLVIGIEK